MDPMGIASLASNMRTAYLHSEVEFRAMKLAIDISELECQAMMDMIDAAMTGVGVKLDVLC